MQCPRCKFENMPGQTACFQCGSALEAGAGTVVITPPRAPKWKKPFRRVARWVRHHRTVQQVEGLSLQAARAALTSSNARLRQFGLRAPNAEPPDWLEVQNFLRAVTRALFMSIVPGFAQWRQGRLGDVVWLSLEWLAAFVVAVLFYGGTIGAIALGIAVVLHGWIAADSVRLIEKTPGFGVKLSLTFAYGICFGAFYLLASYPVTGGTAAIDIPARDVKLRDYVLCWRDDGPSTLRRGDLVLVTQMQRRGRWRFLYPAGDAVGQLIGLPGETVTAANGRFTIDGVQYDPEALRVPAWFGKATLGVKLEEDRYFVAIEYRTNMALGSAVRQACVMEPYRFRGHGFAVWMPVTRKHRLPRPPEQASQQP